MTGMASTAHPGRSVARTKGVRELVLRATRCVAGEFDTLSFLPKSRYDRSLFPTVGQYDWLSGRVLYALVRETKPRTIIEFSTSSGYSTMFSALALAQNGGGTIHTVDINASAQHSASRLVSSHGLTNTVRFHLGDCRLVVPSLLDDSVDMVFIDTLHSFEIALWYLRHVIPKLRDDALVQIHDVMPPEARVRVHGGPPYDPACPGPRMTATQLVKRAIWLALHGQVPNPIPRQPPSEILPLHRLEVHRDAGRLPTIDGNYFEEGALLRELCREASQDDVVYLHRLLSDFGDLAPQEYASGDLVGRTDADGRELEWNEALWTRASTLRALSDQRHVNGVYGKLRRRYGS